MSVNQRIVDLREALGIKQKDMSERLGFRQGSLSDIERGKTKTVTDRVIRDICREFNVNEEWLRTGAGEMFKELAGNDEIATYVYSLLSDTENPFHDLIIEIMRTYHELEPKAKLVIDETIARLVANVQKKKRD